MIVIGVDPGLSGAIAFLIGERVVGIIDMPTAKKASGRREMMLRDLTIQIARFVPQSSDVRGVWIENVSSSPQMGVASSFSFGRCLGAIEGIAAALAWPVEYVTPGKWKRDLKAPKEKPGARKRASDLMPASAELWTPQKGHCTQEQANARAEAAMIGLFGVRTVADAAPRRREPADLFAGERVA